MRRTTRLAELRTSDMRASEANKIAATQKVEPQPSISSRKFSYHDYAMRSEHISNSLAWQFLHICNTYMYL